MRADSNEQRWLNVPYIVEPYRTIPYIFRAVQGVMYEAFRTVPYHTEVPDVRVRRMYGTLFSRTVPYRHVECIMYVYGTVRFENVRYEAT